MAGFFDMDGSTDKDPDSTNKQDPQGGATLQFRSGFGTGSDASPSVPLYALDAFDLRTYARVPDPPVEELFMGGGGYHCTGKDDCPTYERSCSKLYKYTPAHVLLLTRCLSACALTGFPPVPPRSTLALG